MKNLLIIIFTILLIGLLQPAVAQEKQSDATWEETISFISKYKSHIDIAYTYSFNRYWDYKIYYIHVTNSQINIKARMRPRDEYSDEVHIKIPLQRLQSVDYSYRTGISTSSKYIDFSIYRHVKRTPNSRKPIKRVSRIKIGIPDSEMKPRLTKAFQHLAYLATEKRKAEREASGDAF